MLYTASFWAKTDLPRYSIALSQPKGMALPRLSCVMPPSSTFRDIKAGRIDWAEYTRQYLEMLDDNRQYIMGIMETFAEPVVLCCWERHPENCHRSLLAAWLTKNGIPTEELE